MKLRSTDILFSQMIRTRDKWTCQRCRKRYEPPTQGLHCSHYWGRARENTRFDPYNCVALCFGCHRIWGHGDGRDEYTAFMEKRLGKIGFQKLKIRAYLYRKKDDKLTMMILKELQKNGTF